jgi:CubicO group peptidase (beta-lactamase class C family)
MSKTILRLSIALAATAASLSTSATPSPLTPAAVQTFTDHKLDDLLRRSWVPGATVAVVQNDRVVLVKGYGIANVDTGETVDGQRSLFRIGSITKVMTTMAALRLAEQGRLDLDSDVNRYLHSLRVEPAFDEPVTARLLMTHRGGFDSSIVGLMFSKDAETILSPEARQRAFVRARPVTAPFYYDNLGFGLLGTVIADIERTTTREALRRLVFAPLQMKTAVIGLPAEREREAASCHRPDVLGRAAVCEHGLIADVSQGGGDASVSAADMAQLMRALIVPGRLLRQETLQQMKNTDTQRLHPLLPGLGLALREADYAGYRTIGHHGSINGFVSEFALFPAQGIAVFISVNGEDTPAGPRMASSVLGEGVATGAIDARPLVEEFIGSFARQFVPPPAAPSTTVPAIENEPTAAQLAGIYSRPDESMAKEPGPTVSSPTRVRLTDDGHLDAYDCAPFIRKAPMYYECAPAVGAPIKLGFKRDTDGRLLLGHIAIEALVQQPPADLADNKR